MTLKIVPLDPLDPADDELFDGWQRVTEEASRAEYGDRHTRWSANEVRTKYRDQHDERYVAFAGLLDGDVVGHLEVTLPVTDNNHRAVLGLAVHPDHRRRGVGSMLLDLGERIAREEKRDVVEAMFDVAAGHDDPAEGFAARHGYVQAQSELHSDLDLPVPDDVLAAANAEARAASTGYEVLTSWDGIPDEWLADRAELSRRMSTDAPLGELTMTEEVWDGERVRRNFDLALAQGRRVVESVARHTETGRLVGFTTIGIARHTPHMAYQWDTLVLREHRGHRLGLLLKAANLQALTAELPDVERIVTWNAAENEPMLRVNRALGFQVVGRLNQWQRHLD